MSERRTTAERRHYNQRAIARKLYIAKEVYREKEYPDNPERTWVMIRQPNRLSKGKIHCSCPMCSYHGTPAQDKRSFLKSSEELSVLPLRHRNRSRVKANKDAW